MMVTVVSYWLAAYNHLSSGLNAMWWVPIPASTRVTSRRVIGLYSMTDDLAPYLNWVAVNMRLKSLVNTTECASRRFGYLDGSVRGEYTPAWVIAVTVLCDLASMMNSLLLWPPPITAIPSHPMVPPAFTTSKALDAGDSTPAEVGLAGLAGADELAAVVDPAAALLPGEQADATRAT